MIEMICPQCNALTELKVQCSVCQNDCEDKGRAMDYDENYSPYMDYELSALTDGLTKNNSNLFCAHLYYCKHCNDSVIKLIEKI
jgi:hypothetical protein